MPIRPLRLVRKMRGGAQAHLLACDDGHFYVVKFLNNPQHRRILPNEWIAAVFLDYLNISAPAAEIVEVTPQFLAANPDIHFQLGNRRIEVSPGWHFGSRYPGDPAKLAVYDFLPDPLLDKVVNRSDFLGALAFDKWMGNADARQSVFFRARLRDWLPDSGVHPLKAGFLTQVIDNGFVFSGPEWTLADSPLLGLYFRRQVYAEVRGLAGFEPWLQRIVEFPLSVVDRARRGIPPQWIEGDEDSLDELLDRLMRRRRRVPDLIAASAADRRNPFPAWGRP